MDFPLKPVTHFFIPRLADRFIVISNFMRENFITRGINPARIQLLYNPLDLNYFRPNPILRKASREQLGLDESDIVIGFIGAMHPHKGVAQLAEILDCVMAKIPNLKALWVGEGPAEQDVQTLIQNGKFANRHIFHKWTPDVRPYYAAMDMLAIPSIVNEAFGRVSLEAQACGIPVLCSNNGGLPETLQPGITGLLLPPGDVPAWCDAIIKLAQDAQLRIQLQNNGRDWVDRTFSTTAIAKQFTALLEDAQLGRA
jgi:glycosyltransferase involved in cell wall biosynthesis